MAEPLTTGAIGTVVATGVIKGVAATLAAAAANEAIKAVQESKSKAPKPAKA